MELSAIRMMYFFLNNNNNNIEVMYFISVYKKKKKDKIDTLRKFIQTHFKYLFLGCIIKLLPKRNLYDNYNLQIIQHSIEEEQRILPSYHCMI